MQDKGDFYYFCCRIEVTLDAMIEKVVLNQRINRSYVHSYQAHGGVGIAQAEPFLPKQM